MADYQIKVKANGETHTSNVTSEHAFAAVVDALKHMSVASLDEVEEVGIVEKVAEQEQQQEKEVA